MIRRMEEKDIDDVLELLKEVNLVHHLGRPDLFKKATKYSKDNLLEMINDDNNPIFVYEDNNHVVGHAFLETIIKGNRLVNNIKTLYIDDICVKKEERNKGIASGLFDYIKKYAKDNGYYNIELNVWSFNDNAYKFYEKMGLKPQKVTMEKIL